MCRPSSFAIFVSLALLVACGGVSRRVLVEAQRDSYESLFAGLIEVAAERGLEARERRGAVSVVVDRSTGARISFVPRRGGLYMNVGVRTDDEAEDAELAMAEAELSRLESLGQELIAAARERARRIDEDRAARELEELAARRREDEARRAEESRRAASPGPGVLFGLPGVTTTDAVTSGVPSGVPSGGDRCCINGSFYECPDAASLDRCGGAFARCMVACDFACTDACLSSSPPDPSGCSRVPARDGEC